MTDLYRDPWAKREAWRKHPIFSMRYYVRHMFPGLGLGAVALGRGGDAVAVDDDRDVVVRRTLPAR